MRRKRVRVWDLSHPSGSHFLVLAAAFFACGLAAGFALSGHISLPMEVQFRMDGDVSVSVLRLLRLFWSQFRWLLLAGLLAMTALGLFLLYPLVFLRGVLIGFSFTSLFVPGAYGFVLMYFLCTVVLTCAPLLLMAACGMKRALGELRRGGEDGILDRPVFPLLLLLASLVLTFACSCAELWFLPGFVSYIQPVT